jgi:hypothetical protein
MDADPATSPKKFRVFWRAWDRNADIWWDRVSSRGPRRRDAGLEALPELHVERHDADPVRIAVKDKTSGFRVYRVDALRELDFENGDFAFLPELLIRAIARGMRIVEEPIHFIFRTRGTSKMQIGKTAVSYLSLLKLAFRHGRKEGSVRARGRAPDP